MSMEKRIDPSDWDLGEPAVAQVKMATDGCKGDDLKAFIKRAGHWLADEIRRLDVAPGEVPIHCIAMGTTETYGSNRNGDGWRAPYLERYHPTFVKHAHWFREHDNKDPQNSYGVVKRSYFNAPMQRVELIVSLNGSREAAQRNRGLIAHKELEKLASGLPLGVSMSCRVPADYCSFCGNRARTRAEYCQDVQEGGLCKGGGLKNNIGVVLENGHVLHADNRESDFFDISHVHKPADRTAWVTGQLEKSASLLLDASAPLPGRDEPIFSRPLPEQLSDRLIKLAANLAAYETTADPALWLATCQPVDSSWDLPGSVKLAHAVRALADLEVLPSPEAFLHLFGGAKATQATPYLQAALPGSFQRLTKSAVLQEAAAPWHEMLFCRPAPGAVRWARTLVRGHGIDPQQISERVKYAFLTQRPRLSVKRASATALSLADSYNGLRLTLLDQWRTRVRDFGLTCRAVAAQNLS